MPESADGNGGSGGPKPAARFVRDVTIFDGTQMAPGTKFTKIWRLKNVGDVPWPPGTKMLFVGGDQMTTEMSVPLSRASAVMPGEEVDVAVEMTAPTEHGRYLGYWRLTGPRERRKFGQRVWCHVQVVDPDQSASSMVLDQADLDAARAEIASKKQSLAATETDAGDADETEAPDKADETMLMKEATATAAETVAVADKADKEVTNKMPIKEVAETALAEKAPAKEVADKEAADKEADEKVAVALEAAAAAESHSDGGFSDDCVLINADDTMDKDGEPGPSGAMSTPQATAPDVEVATGTKAKLLSMGFVDGDLVDAVIAKNGSDDLEACVRDMAAATEWEPLLNDLAEMGFANRALNQSLMLKNGGNIKRTVKDLVEA